MMQQADMKSYQTDRDLRGCGLTPESINAIKSTTVITRDGAQHVVPTSQAHLDESGEAKSQVNSGLSQQVQDLSRMFSRYKQFSEQRIMTLEQQVAQLQEYLKEQNNTLLTIKSNQIAQHKANTAPEGAKAPAKTGIDRNKVAPDKVQVEDIFYSGTRR